MYQVGQRRSMALTSRVATKVARRVVAAEGLVAAIGLVALLASMALACVPSGRRDEPAEAAAPRPSGKPQSGLATATLRSGAAEIVVELAVSPEEQEIGLMHRTELADGLGMLFVYAEDRRLAFWMKHTLIPLSIAYISSDGVIREIRDMEPLSLAPVESERYVRYALEAPLGWFGRVGLAPGDRFDQSGLPGR